MSQQLYAKAIELLGVSEHQFYVLAALAHLGPQVQAHLSEPLQIDKATMVGLINDLEHKGLVQRQPHPTDRRAVLIHLTDAGRAMLGHGYEISKRFEQHFFKGIKPEEQELLLTILKRLAANANELAATFESNEIIAL